VKDFKQDPLWEEKVALRRWDDEAKRTDINAPGLETLRPVVEKVLIMGQCVERVWIEILWYRAVRDERR